MLISRHLKVSDAEKCKLTGGYKADRFGDTEQACHEGYFQYNHTYSCENGTEDVTIDGKTIKACKFEIGVQAKDNWGWCNGNHKDPNWGPEADGSGGAYEATCDSMGNKYEYYDGYIYMIP